MGARKYVTSRADKIDKGKINTLEAVESLHAVQREVLQLRQIAQIERLREPDTSLANAMEENVSMLTGLEGAFDAVVGAVEKLPTSFEAVDRAEKRLEAALPSTAPLSSGASSSSGP